MDIGSKELLLEQRIPATYLALEDVVIILATDKKNNGRDLTLSVEEYRTDVVHIKSSARFCMSFRDTAELNQVNFQSNKILNQMSMLVTIPF